MYGPTSSPAPHHQYYQSQHQHQHQQQPNLSYAPVASTATPSAFFPNANRTIALDVELKPFDSPSSRDLLDSLAELYSIIRTLDGLEKAYQKDALAEHEYTDIAGKLLRQYRSLLGDERVSAEFGSLDDFVQKWDLDAPRAMETLRIGLTRDEVYRGGPPAADMMGVGGSSSASHGHSALSHHHHHGGPPQTQSSTGPSATAILTATENFITFLDALRLNMLSKSSLHPLLSDVIQSVNKVTQDQDFEGRGKIIQWLITLNGLRATEELSEDMARECAFDLEGAYAGFKNAIS